MTKPAVDLRDAQDRRLPRISPPCGLVIFGITGDLARKKLLPAIYDLANRGLLNPAFALTGFARRDWSPADFEDYVRASIEKGTRTGFNERTWQQLRSGLRFVSGAFGDPAAYSRLADTVAELDRTRGTGGNHAFYLSIPPSWFPVVSQRLAETGLNQRSGRAFRRVIVEKPFGRDLVRRPPAQERDGGRGRQPGAKERPGLPHGGTPSPRPRRLLRTAAHPGAPAPSRGAGEVRAMIDVRVLPNEDALVAEAARAIAEELADLAHAQERVGLAIAGGFVAQRLLPTLAPFADRVDWSHVDVFWVDERFIPADSADRNDAEAIGSFLSAVAGVSLHPMPHDSGQGLEAAAEDALDEWEIIMAGRSLDLAILGMGPDGHVASLFPGRALREDVALYAIEDSPKPPPRRLTLSLPVLRAAGRVHLLAAGSAKAVSLARAIDEADGTALDDAALPAARVLSDDAVVWTDEAGAALIGR